MPSKKPDKFNSAEVAENPRSPMAQSPPLGGGFGRDLSNWLFPLFLGLILVAVFIIWKFGAAGGTTNPVRAMFIAMNAATLTGFNGSPGVSSALNNVGQWTTFILIISGSLFTMIAGGLAVIRIAHLKFTDRELILSAFIVETLFVLVGTSLLWDSDRSPFQAAFLAASAFGNCGLYLGALPGVSNVLAHAVILPLTVLGGLGLPVLMEFWCALIFHEPLSEHSKTVISATGWLYVIGLIGIVLLTSAGRGWTNWTQLQNQLPTASVLAIESRTGGMPIADLSATTAPARWFLVALMAVGANSAGTGSGLKTTTIAELARGTRRLLKAQPPGRSFAIAFVWLATYLALALGAVLLLSYVSIGDPPDNLLFNAVSAVSNVGLTVSAVPDEKGLYFAFNAIILVGRMAPLMILWWMAETTGDAELAVG